MQTKYVKYQIILHLENALCYHCLLYFYFKITNFKKTVLSYLSLNEYDFEYNPKYETTIYIENSTYDFIH